MYKVDRRGYVWEDSTRPAVAQIVPQEGRGRDTRFLTLVSFLDKAEPGTESEKLAALKWRVEQAERLMALCAVRVAELVELDELTDTYEDFYEGTKERAGWVTLKPLFVSLKEDLGQFLIKGETT